MRANLDPPPCLASLPRATPPSPPSAEAPRCGHEAWSPPRSLWPAACGSGSIGSRQTCQIHSGCVGAIGSGLAGRVSVSSCLSSAKAQTHGSSRWRVARDYLAYIGLLFCLPARSYHPSWRHGDVPPWQYEKGAGVASPGNKRRRSKAELWRAGVTFVGAGA